MTARAGREAHITRKFAYVRVLDGKVPLTGLFVIYRVIAKDPDAPQIRACHDADDDTKDVAPPPPRPMQFALGFVDGDGYLQPVLDGRNPWHEIFPHGHLARGRKGPRGRNPHAWQLPLVADVELLLIRHPSPDRARTLLAVLNNPGPPAATSSRYAMPSAEEVERLTCKKTVNNGVLNLEALDAAAFWPAGPTRYAGWTLYHDMPHAHRKELVEAVEKLRADLGKLRYPFRGGTPYEDVKAAPTKPAPTKPKSKPAVIGSFDGGVLAAVAGFQRDASEGHAFKVANKAAAHDASNVRDPKSPWPGPMPGWGYLRGAPMQAGVPRFGGDDDGSLEEHGRPEWGVVDVRTAAVMAHWLADRPDGAGLARPFRRPGDFADGAGSLTDKLLVAVITRKPGADGNWCEWVVPDLAVRLELLRHLVVALGCPYGIAVNHTFREISSPGGKGKAECSIHKTGRSVDFAMVGAASRDILDYREPIGAWPIRYEGDWVETDQLKQRCKSLKHRLDKLSNEIGRTEKQIRALGKPPAQPERRRQLSELLRALEEKEKPLIEENKVAQADFDDSKKRTDERKLGHRLRWRLFGHSTWDVAAEADPRAALARRLGVTDRPGPASTAPGGESEYGLVDRLAATLAAFIGTTTADPWLIGAKQLARTVVDELLALPPNLLDEERGIFRAVIGQWIYNPLTPSGKGGDDQPIAAKSDSPKSRDYLNQNRREPAQVPGEMTRSEAGEKVWTSLAKTWLNITRLAWFCGLHRIGPQMQHIRAPDPDDDGEEPPTTVYAVGQHAGTIAGLLKRLEGAGGRRAAQVIKVSREIPPEDGIATPTEKEIHLRLDDIALEFMASWCNSVSKGAAVARSAPGFSATIELAPREEGKKRRAAIHAFFDRTEFASRSFFRLPTSGIQTLAGVKLPDVATGAEWGKLLSENGPERTIPSTQKGREDWCIVLQPVFQKNPPARLEDVAFLAEDFVEMPAPGVGRALEWWHYETREANETNWSDMLASIGYSRDYLVAPREPPREDVPFGPHGRGLGFIPGGGRPGIDRRRGGAFPGEVDRSVPVENGP